MNFRHSAAVAAIAAGVLCAPAAQAQSVLYSQPYNGVNGYFASEASQYVEADSFVIGTTGTIGSVSWEGADLNELIPGSVVNPTSFDIQILASNAAGLPGTVVSSTTVGNSGNAVSTGNQFEGQLTVFNYTATLSTPFTAQAGQTYWIEINDPTTNRDWFWMTGAGPDGTHELSTKGKGFTSQTDDLDFTLYSATAVPEPGSVGMMGLGLAALALVRRRRSR